MFRTQNPILQSRRGIEVHVTRTCFHYLVSYIAYLIVPQKFETVRI